MAELAQVATEALKAEQTELRTGARIRKVVSTTPTDRKITKKVVRHYLDYLGIRDAKNYPSISDAAKRQAIDFSHEKLPEKWRVVTVQYARSRMLADEHYRKGKDSAFFHAIRAHCRPFPEHYLTDSEAFRSDRPEQLLRALKREFNGRIVVVTDVKLFKRCSFSTETGIHLIWAG